MDITQNINLGVYDITLVGKFTFNDHTAFREILEKIETPAVTRIVFHMAQVDFVDSAALGMLLLALDTATKHQKKITISGATGQVKKMFDMSRFNGLFTMS